MVHGEMAWLMIGAFIWVFGVTLAGYFLADAIGDSIDKYLYPLIAAIIILSLSLEYIVAWIQERRGTDPHSRREWVANHMLQVQRAAFEANGVGSWYRRSASIPITDSDMKLAALMQAGDAYGSLQRRETRATEDRKSEDLKKGWQRVDSGPSLSPGLPPPKDLGRVDTDRTLT